MSNMRVRTIIAGAVLLAACSSDDTGSSSQPRTAEGLETAARAGAEAIINAPVDSWDYLSEDCQAQWGAKGEWASNVGAGMLLVEGFTGIDMKDAEVGEVTATVDGDRGEVIVELLDDGEPLFTADEDEPDPWVYENGGWRTTSCEKVEDGFSASTGQPKCEDLVGETIGEDINCETAEGTIAASTMLECDDGRVLRWNDGVIGYEGEEAREFGQQLLQNLTAVCEG